MEILYFFPPPFLTFYKDFKETLLFKILELPIPLPAQKIFSYRFAKNKYWIFLKLAVSKKVKGHAPIMILFKVNGKEFCKKLTHCGKNIIKLPLTKKMLNEISPNVINIELAKPTLTIRDGIRIMGFSIM